MTRAARIPTFEVGPNRSDHRRKDPSVTTATKTGAQDPRTEAAVRTFTVILVAAAASTTVAVLAGVSLLVTDPASGSTTEAVFGFTAAVSGLVTAALVIGAVIYAQSRNLWRFVPGWIRLAVLGLVAIAAVRSLVAAIS